MKIFWREVKKIANTSKEKGLLYPPFWVFDDLIIGKTAFYDLYRLNSDIKSCVRKIANYVGRDWFALKNKNDETVEYDKARDDYDFMYSFLANPTFSQTKVELFKHLTTCWEVYLLPTTVAGKSEVNGFQVIHPKTITKVVQKGKIVKFRQTMAGSFKEYEFEETKEKTKWLQMYVLEKHTDNELNGMGVLEWLFYDAIWDLDASKRNYYAIRNDNTPPSILIVEDWLSQEKLNFLAEQIKDKHQWPENVNKMLVGIGVKDIKTTSLSPKDMEYISQRKLTTDKVTAAYWVPKAILWYTENVNYNNAGQMYKELIEWTINPYQSFFEYIVNDFLEKYRPDFSKRHYVEFYKIDPTDQFEVSKLNMQKVMMGWMSVDEFREEEGRAPRNTDESKKPLMTRNVVLMEDIGLDPILDMNNS